MAWARDNTPADASFLVVTGSYWPIDATAEWFSALSDRRSANTVQGKEFTSPAAWEHAVNASGSLDECVTGTAQCLVDWGAAVGRPLRLRLHFPAVARRVSRANSKTQLSQ